MNIYLYLRWLRKQGYPKKRVLNIYGPCNNLGMGTHCINFARALEKSGEEVCLIPPFGNVAFRDTQIESWLARRHNFDRNNPGLMIFDIDFFTQFIGKPRVGFAVFETDGFTPRQLSALKSCDMILTPSEWGRRVLSLHGIEAHVVHEGYDPEVFKPFPLSPENRKGTIKFCHVGKMEERKGTMQILGCFFEALENEDAILEMPCDNPFHSSWYYEIVDRLVNLGFQQSCGVGVSAGNRFISNWRRAGLTIILRPPQAESMVAVYAGSDCGLFPSKGEGWGLPILECLATGVPAIVGNWTGQSEYLTDSYPQELTLEKYHTELAHDGRWYFGNRGNWNVPEDQELIEKIRWAHKNIRDFRTTGRWASEVERIREYTWDAAVVQFKKILYK